MLDTLKTYLVAFTSAIVAVLFGLLKYEKYKREAVETELDTLEHQTKDEIELKEFQAINKERADNVENSNDDIHPSTSYRL